MLLIRKIKALKKKGLGDDQIGVQLVRDISNGKLPSFVNLASTELANALTDVATTAHDPKKLAKLAAEEIIARIASGRIQHVSMT